MNATLPQRRTQDLIVQNMDNELVLYDTNRARANVLNHTAATIWKLCDGSTGVSEIATRAVSQLNMPVDEALVWYTLDQLSKKNLLQTRAALPSVYQKLTRRDFLRAGLVGAAVVVPVIVTMTAPQVSHAASCIASGQSCQTSPQCCSGLCNDGTCA